MEIAQLRNRAAIHDCNTPQSSLRFLRKAPQLIPIIYNIYMTEPVYFPQTKHGDRFFLCNLKVRTLSNFGELLGALQTARQCTAQLTDRAQIKIPECGLNRPSGTPEPCDNYTTQLSNHDSNQMQKRPTFRRAFCFVSCCTGLRPRQAPAWRRWSVSHRLPRYCRSAKSRR